MADRDPHGRALQRAADELGLASRDRSHDFPPDGLEFSDGAGATVIAVKGRRFPWLRTEAERTLDDKGRTKRTFMELGIPTPLGTTFSDPAAVAFPVGRPQVCKPVIGTHGQGVVLGLRTSEELQAHCAADLANAWILEDQVEGRDLRLQALQGRLVAACVRRPAQVVGDGRRTLRDLMQALDDTVRTLNPGNRCVPDADTARALGDRCLDDAPDAGAVVPVKTVANLAVGATAVDVTGDLHPTWGRWVEAFAAALELPFFALDAVTTDPSADPLASGAAVLEANARPEWLHHTFSEGRTHDMARQILLAAMAWASERSRDPR